jgi:hypothetical protein
VEARELAGYRAVGRLYNALMTGLVLTLVSQRGADTAAAYVMAHFRRQHLEKFLPGLRKLGLDGLPHAVACAQYHFFSNALGGVKTEFIPESDRKAWVRYPPPRWIWQGAAICGIPRVVNEAMLHGWHGHNGVSLGNPRLGFVCTGQTVNGDPGLEGYYYEYDRPLAEDERVLFSDERAPFPNPATTPKLDVESWPALRRAKVERSYAVEYVRTMLAVMFALYPRDEAIALMGRTARLIGLQYYDDAATALRIADRSPEAFAQMLAEIGTAQGEAMHADGSRVVQSGWRLIDGLPVSAEVAFAAWSPLWTGMLAVHDRRLGMRGRVEGGDLVWEVQRPD